MYNRRNRCLGLFWDDFQKTKQNPSDTWIHPSTSIVNSDFCKKKLFAKPLVYCPYFHVIMLLLSYSRPTYCYIRINITTVVLSSLLCHRSHCRRHDSRSHCHIAAVIVLVHTAILPSSLFSSTLPYCRVIVLVHTDILPSSLFSFTLPYCRVIVLVHTAILPSSLFSFTLPYCRRHCSRSHCHIAVVIVLVHTVILPPSLFSFTLPYCSRYCSRSHCHIAAVTVLGHTAILPSSLFSFTLSYCRRHCSRSH